MLGERHKKSIYLDPHLVVIDHKGTQNWVLPKLRKFLHLILDCFADLQTFL